MLFYESRLCLFGLPDLLVRCVGYCCVWWFTGFACFKFACCRLLWIFSLSFCVLFMVIGLFICFVIYCEFVDYSVWAFCCFDLRLVICFGYLLLSVCDGWVV